MKETRIEPHDSRVVSKSLEAYVGNLIAEGNFFADLSTRQANLENVRGVFGQYYLWRNQFHRWFGICVARSAPFGEALNVLRILGELIACLEQEIKGDHHGLALSFLAALGIDDPSRITALPVTDTHAELFLRCYFSGAHEFSCHEVPAAILRTTQRPAGSRSVPQRSAPGHA